jgi:hypothetical protein
MAGLDLHGRDFEPPVIAAPLEMPAEFEANEVAQPQRPVGPGRRSSARRGDFKSA